MENNIEYVVGLVFDNKNRVMFIEKNRPDWQKGYLNGVGGKIEDAETSKYAIQRECKEESGLNIDTWKIHNHKIFDNGISLYYMKSKVDSLVLDKAVSLTDEKISIHNIDNLPERVQPDIREMIQYCIAKDENK